MFAGHDESGGTLVEEDGQWYKDFYGMSSATAMEKYAGGVAEYRSSEGKHVRVPYRGPVGNTWCGQPTRLTRTALEDRFRLMHRSDSAHAIAMN